jgi:hypothetical protein
MSENLIKYLVGATPSNCLKKGDMLIGINRDAEYGTTFFTGINPPANGHTIYLNKASQGPSIYCPSTDNSLILITNQIAGQNYTTAAECIDYYAGENDKIINNRNYEKIVTDGLILNLDAGFTPSYPTTGTTWYDISGNDKNGTLTNGPSFSSGDDAAIVFDGTDDYVGCGIISNAPSGTANRTIQVWVKDTSTSDYDVLASYSGYGDDFTFNPPGDGRLFMLAIGGANFNNRKLIVWTNSRNHISSFSITRDTWTNVAVTVTSGPTLTIYKNGVADAGSVQNIDTSNTQPYTVGYSNQFYSALKGEVAINLFYNRALSPGEIQQNFDAQKGRFGF